MADATPPTTLMLPVPPAPRPLHAGKVLALALVIGSPALVGGAFFTGFLNYDDHRIILQNPLAREGFTARAIEQVARPPAPGFKGFYSQYIPLTYFTLGLQYRLHGPRAWAFRLVNLLFHLGTALLLYRLLLALLPQAPATSIAQDVLNADTPFRGRDPALAALASAFFFFHPTNVESVAWASERNNVQALFLAVLAWWLMARGSAHPAEWGRLAPAGPARAAPALAAYAAALLSKPSAIGFAPLLILTELIWVHGPWRARLARCACWAGLAAAAALLALSAARNDVLPLTGGSYWSWALTSFALLGRCLSHTLAPLELSFFYGIAPAGGLSDPWVWGTLGLLAGVVLALAWLATPARAAAVLLPAGLLALAPTLGPQTISFLFQDRYLYFSLPIAAGLLAFAGQALHYRLRFLGESRSRRSEMALLGVGVAVCFALALLALGRSYDFRDDETLFRDAVSKQPQSFFGHYCLAQELLLQGNRAAQRAEQPHELWREAFEHVQEMKTALDAQRHPSRAVQELLEAELAWRLGRSEARELLRGVLAGARPEQKFVLAKAHWICSELAREEYARTRQRARLDEQISHLRLAISLTPPSAPEAPALKAKLAEALQLARPTRE